MWLLGLLYGKQMFISQFNANIIPIEQISNVNESEVNCVNTRISQHLICVSGTQVAPILFQAEL